MKMFRLMAILAAIAAPLSVGLTTQASAQATRTWVSGTGSDANPCSRTAPCQTFSGALSKTAAAGEINAIDPGGFGTLNITKSITIDGGGTMASLLSVNTNGVIVNGAGILVTLRNIVINGGNGTTGNGIRILQAGAVNIDNVQIENQNATGLDTQGRGISIETATAGVRVTVTNSQIVNFGRYGIHSIPSAGSVQLNVDRTSIINGLVGIQLRQLTNAVISNSFITGHTAGSGITAELTSVNTTVNNTTIAGNSFGILNGNGGNPITRVYGSTITNNTVDGLRIISGQLISSGNNIIRGNAGNEVPSSTLATN
jgi:hypothetical protein